jgi:hypothetical protein
VGRNGSKAIDILIIDDCIVRIILRMKKIAKNVVSNNVVLVF